MINILILDDNLDKIREICEVISEYKEIGEEYIEFVHDTISAKRALLSKKFDLFFLDIQIPNRVNQPAILDGGFELLEELLRSQKYYIPDKIVSLTGYEDSYNKYRDKLLDIIKYEEKSSNWQQDISRHIKYILDVKKATNPKTNISYDYDLAIICALDKVELESVLELSKDWDIINDPDDNTIYRTCVFEDSGKKIRAVAAAAEQMGMTAAAVLAMKIIEKFRPYYLVITGIAAGVEDATDLGDILVADPSWDYGSGKIKEVNNEPVFFPDPLQIRLDIDVKSKIKLISEDKELLKGIKDGWLEDKPDSELKIHIGPVGSGAAVLAHPSVIESIKIHARKLVGIDMETYGVLYSAENCSKPRPIAFSIKSVCDFADSRKGDKYQAYAAYTSSLILYELVMKYLDFDGKNIVK